MKHALKILIPIVLVIALLIAVAWFFLSYRPDLTCQFCMDRGEAAIERGNYSRAIKCYSLAWDLYPSDPDIAIALANAYKRADNYTKAEYTLVSAITSIPDELNLYLELSRTYVEQDKLLDADQMLSRTANDAIKEQLDALRPDAPLVQPESGSYDEYIDVSLSYAAGAAYLALDGEYPSLAKNLYTEPMTLPDGESTIVAIVVSDDGLVSPAVTAGYMIGGVIEEVAFVDSAVENAVRSVLNKGEDEPIMTNEMWALTTLDLPSDAKVLSDLTICHALTSLSMHDTYGVDFSVLSQLTNLQTLDLSNCTVSSSGVAAIGSLPNLVSLNLSSCALTDVSALSGLTKLTTLDLSNNAISDISCLSGMSALTDVTLSTNTITSIAPLAAANNLQFLDISTNQIANLSALNNKQSLAALNASANQISDLAPLENCSALQILDLSDNQVTDLTPVSKLENLTSLSADQNTIATIPDFSTAASLSKVSLNNNAISDLSGFSGLPVLNYVCVDYNQITDLAVLESCQNLVQVDAFGNAIADPAVLLEHGIIVNYDPTQVAEDTE